MNRDCRTYAEYLEAVAAYSIEPGSVSHTHRQPLPGGRFQIRTVIHVPRSPDLGPVLVTCTLGSHHVMNRSRVPCEAG